MIGLGSGILNDAIGGTLAWAGALAIGLLVFGL